MCNELCISPNHKVIKILRKALLINLIEEESFEFMNILMNYGDSHQALMQLNLSKYKTEFEEFIRIQKNFMAEYPNFENKDILDKEIKFIESLIDNMEF
jgi:hypothetical protein